MALVHTRTQHIVHPNTHCKISTEGQSLKLALGQPYAVSNSNIKHRWPHPINVPDCINFWTPNTWCCRSGKKFPGSSKNSLVTLLFAEGNDARMLATSFDHGNSFIAISPAPDFSAGFAMSLKLVCRVLGCLRMQFLSRFGSIKLSETGNHSTIACSISAAP